MKSWKGFWASRIGLTHKICNFAMKKTGSQFVSLKSVCLSTVRVKIIHSDFHVTKGEQKETWSGCKPILHNFYTSSFQSFMTVYTLKTFYSWMWNLSFRCRDVKILIFNNIHLLRKTTADPDHIYYHYPLFNKILLLICLTEIFHKIGSCLYWLL